MTTILVVDDDPPILDLLTDMIEEYGHTVLRAENGKQALALAHQHHPEIIITDIMMPVMDGYALLEAVRSTPELARICVVLASAGVTKLRNVTEPFLADGYMQKPFLISEVEHLVELFANV